MAGKESCFERISSRFGRKPVYVVVGDGRGAVEIQNEAIAAKQVRDWMDWNYILGVHVCFWSRKLEMLCMIIINYQFIFMIILELG